MKPIRSVLVVTAAAALSAGTASGQGRKPQVAGIAPAPKPAAEDATVFPRRGHHPALYQGAVPVLVTNDGQIYADFGYGYEAVIRSCAYAGGVAYAPAAPSPSYVAPVYTAPTYTPPTYTPPNYGQTTFGPRNTQPAPAQATQSERDLAASRAAQAAPAPQVERQRPGSRSCWRADEQGRVIVVRP